MIKKEVQLTRAKMLTKLAEIGKLTEPATTLYLPAGFILEEAEKTLSQITSISTFLPEITRFIAGSATGAVIFWGETHKLVIKPPFPLKEKYLTAGYDAEMFTKLLMKPVSVGILLVRLGYYSIGIAQDEKLVAHKTGTGLVHGRKRQGGSSANRFRRRRVEQTHHFLERVVLHAREMFEPQSKKLDYFVYGGARTTITELCKHSQFFDQFANRLLPPLLDITNPGFDVLQQAATDIWSSRVAEWRETDY